MTVLWRVCGMRGVRVDIVTVTPRVVWPPSVVAIAVPIHKDLVNAQPEPASPMSARLENRRRRDPLPVMSVWSSRRRSTRSRSSQTTTTEELGATPTR
jgi:hypothetical protein